MLVSNEPGPPKHVYAKQLSLSDQATSELNHWVSLVLTGPNHGSSLWTEPKVSSVSMVRCSPQ